MKRSIMEFYVKMQSFVICALPTPVRRRLRCIYHSLFIHKRKPPVGMVRFGNLRRLNPIHDNFGFGTGQVIDRYYMEKFLADHAEDIRGRVLEIGDENYTKLFGGNKVTRSDVLHYVEGNPQATIVSDLSKADNIDSNTFDCIIIVQTLQMIYDVRSAVRHLHRILKPGGVVLATTHGTSKIARFLGVDDWGEYWHLTCQSSRLVFEEFFKPGNVTVKNHGNILTTIAFLHGLVVEDLTSKELDYQDPRFELLIGIRAVK